jgi:hypothetical protein
MKVAVLVSGQPRFNIEFNDLIRSLQTCDQIDFFFHLWDSDPSENQFIPPTWPKDIDSIRNKILDNFTSNCNIASLVVLPQIEYKVTKSYNVTPWSNPVNIWYTYYGIKQVNLLREEYEKENGAYDLVIKARPDAGLTKFLNCKAIKEYLDTDPLTVLMPNDRRFGMAGTGVNDLIGIGLSSTMSTYCRAIDYFDQYNDEGCPYHGETLLAWHLNKNNIQTPSTDFNCTFREYWYAENKPNFGNWL